MKVNWLPNKQSWFVEDVDNLDQAKHEVEVEIARIAAPATEKFELVKVLNNARYTIANDFYFLEGKLCKVSLDDLPEAGNVAFMTGVYLR